MTPYNIDFYAWTQEQAQRLKNGQWDQLDIENLVEEIESLGRQERRQLVNHLRILLAHMVQWYYQPHKRSSVWESIIREQRRYIFRILDESPSLQPYLEEALALGYEDGVDLVIQKNNLSEKAFPIVCPYTLDQVLDTEFFPNEIVPMEVRSFLGSE